jgi:DNA-binding transcriptional LysR family regulator
VYRWEFDKDGQSVTVVVNGPLIVDDVEVMTRAAIDDVGLAYMTEEYASRYLASGVVVRVLEDWCPAFPGYLLYYPSRRQQPAALAALVETLRLQAVRRVGITGDWTVFRESSHTISSSRALLRNRLFGKAMLPAGPTR